MYRWRGSAKFYSSPTDHVIFRVCAKFYWSLDRNPWQKRFVKLEAELNKGIKQDNCGGQGCKRDSGNGEHRPSIHAVHRDGSPRLYFETSEYWLCNFLENSVDQVFFSPARPTRYSNCISSANCIINCDRNSFPFIRAYWTRVWIQNWAAQSRYQQWLCRIFNFTFRVQQLVPSGYNLNPELSVYPHSGDTSRKKSDYLTWIEDTSEFTDNCSL